MMATTGVYVPWNSIPRRGQDKRVEGIQRGMVCSTDVATLVQPDKNYTVTWSKGDQSGP